MDKKKRLIISGILLAFGLACLGYAVHGEFRQKAARESMESLRESAKIEPVVGINPEKPEMKKAEEPYQSPIDFSVLEERNPDIYAWITIPDTPVDYPIVQSDEYAKYLNMTVDGVEGLPGSIYTDNINKKDFTDYNTIIYGHNMRDDSMFGGLHKYDETYRKEHPGIAVYLPDKCLNYDVFAAVEHNDDFLPAQFDFSDSKSRQLFLDDLKKDVDTDEEFYKDELVTADDKIITLSTCVGGQDDRRWLVCAVLKEE